MKCRGLVVVLVGLLVCLTAVPVAAQVTWEAGFKGGLSLGKLRGDPDAMRRAVAYLEGNVWKPTLVAQGVYQLPS